jgi:hypothetical protein
LYTIDVPSDAAEAADRRGTGFTDVVNSDLTVGVVYRFQPPNNSDTSAVWETFISNSFGAVTYRLDISGTGAMFANQDVLINTATGLVQAVPSRPYNADVAVTAVDATGDSATVANWSFTAHHADTLNPAYGPNGIDCANGAKVDTTRYDGSFSCNCFGTNFVGDNCEARVALELGSPVVQMTDPDFPEALNWSNRTMWALGRTYFLNPVSISNLSDSTGRVMNQSQLTELRYFTEVNTAGPRLLMDPSTGFVQLTPRELSNTTANVSVTLSGYPDLNIFNITFDVRLADVDNPAAIGPGAANCSNGGVKTDIDDGISEFDLRYACDCSGTRFGGSNCDDNGVTLVVDPPATQQEQPGNPVALAWDDRSKWAIDQSYFLKPVNISNITFSSRERGPVNVTQLRYSIDPAPAGLLIDTSTGFAQLKPQTTSNITAVVYVTYPEYPPLGIGNITFDIRLADVNNTNATGPGNANCSNGVKTDINDGTTDYEFDLNYTCDCTGTGFTGDNCEQVDIATAASSSQNDNQVSLLTYAIVGSLVAVLLVALVATRIQVYRARHRPVDMTALQDEIRGSLGMTTDMNVGPGEMGLTVTFRKSLENAFKSLDHVQAETLARSVNVGLLAELRKQSGLPPRLSDMLKQSDTTVSVDVDSATALVVMKRPANGTLKAVSEELFASDLQRRADKRELVVIGDNFRHAVDEVSVAVPRRIPRELNCNSILRLGVLGEGNFGEVRLKSIQCLCACVWQLV